METTDLKAVQAPTPIDIAEQKAALGEVIRQVEVVDDQNFIRQRFSLVHGSGEHVSFVFRGKEELPTFSGAEQEQTVTDVITTDEKPSFTTEHDFNAWLHEHDDVAEGENTYEEALEDDSHGVEFICSTTPLGVVDAAIKLAELGVGEGAAGLDRLVALRAKLEKREVDEEVIELFDDMFASASVDSQTGQQEEYPSEDASMITALALTGEPSAKRLIEQKRQVTDEQYRIASVKDFEHVSKQEGVDAVREPGDPLTPQELEQLKELGLVAIHTTPTRPQRIEGTDFDAILPTAEYNVGERNHTPRPSIHFSLNHAVVSHMGGDFSERPFTVVERLDSLAEDNGAPAVLYGVDTFFDCNPGEPLKISPDAKIINLVEPTKEGQPFIEIDGQEISIRTGELKASDLTQLRDVLFPEDSEDVGDRRLAQALLQNGTIALLPYEVKRVGQRGDFETAESLKIMDENDKDIMELFGLIQDVLPEDPSDYDYEEALAKQLTKLMSGEIDIADFPRLHDSIIEGARRLIVDKLVAEMGGRVVESDGQSAFIQDKQLSAEIIDFTNAARIRAGLHAYTAEADAEQALLESLDGAATGDLFSSEESIDWTKIDETGLWGKLNISPAQSRRHAVRSGQINMTPKKVEKVDPNDGDGRGSVGLVY